MSMVIESYVGHNKRLLYSTVLYSTVLVDTLNDTEMNHFQSKPTPNMTIPDIVIKKSAQKVQCPLLITPITPVLSI